MRIFLCTGLLVFAVGACSLVLDSKTSSTEAVPDASTSDGGQHDGGGCNPLPDGGFSHDGGGYFPDGGYGSDGGSWYPDAAWYPDGGSAADGGSWQPDGGTWQPDAGF